LRCDPGAFAGRVGQVLTRDLLDGADGHDPAALAAVFSQLLAGREDAALQPR
jgi:hypothetical protein